MDNSISFNSRQMMDLKNKKVDLTYAMVGITEVIFFKRMRMVAGKYYNNITFSDYNFIFITQRKMICMR